ncbi:MULTISPECIES: cytochrome P450 [Thermocrispum]|jgi:cytochrome P450|uniref:Cytochrome P450 n=1 Tax=Thermocrispum agreste TaxID=37925 RepID=A0A2W4JIT7_9PSEU|nr:MULTISPECIES: cytochrome P450 [Thermocrispum]PZM98381.1 MAG: cytochrome P450 [Thermocrispum agreste]
MSDQQRCPVVQFDHHSAEHAKDHVAIYRKLREETPVAWTEAHGGFWVLSSYQAVFEASRDDDTFSSGRHDEYGGPGLSVTIPKAPTAFHIPIELDPPEFRPYRKVVNQVTAPAAVEKLHDTIKHYVTGFIDTIIEKGEADLAVVAGVPAAVTIDWLGLDPAQYQQYVDAMHTLVSAAPGSPEYQHAAEVAVPWVNKTVREHIAYRRKHPADDATTHFINAEVNGRKMTDDEIYSILELVISGGVGTTASLVTQALVWLYQNPGERQRLIDDPSMIDIAVEEFLRVFSPTQALARTVMKDVEFHGCPMRKGDRVLLSWASANRDAAQFKDPDKVDITRWPNRHVAFGIGIHRCAGSHLGKAMAREMIRQVLARMGDYVVDMDNLVTYPDQGTNAGYHRIPVTFTPGKRLLGDKPLFPDHYTRSGK